MKRISYLYRDSCEFKDDKCGDCVSNCDVLLRLKDHESNLGEFDVVLCKLHCFAFTNPYVAEETSKYLYMSRKSADFDVFSKKPIECIKDYLSRRKIKSIVLDKNVESILDFSTGNGRFAIQASNIFPKAIVDAVDYQKTLPIFFKKKPVTYYDIFSFKRKRKRKYDLIILRHVLEHTYRPIELLKFLLKRLKTNGILYVEVPNLNSGCAKIFGKCWKNYYVPRHIFHYTKKSLGEIIANAGLEGEINGNNMPLMGNTVAILTGLDKNSFFVKLFGILLHPIQLLIELLYRSSTCINVKCKIRIKNN